MVIIYCIEDINDLKYVGSTKMKLSDRFQAHKSKKDCSSTKLNLYNAIIYPLEECEEDLRKEKEQYWINKIDCVNIYKAFGFNKKEYHKEYKKNNRERINELQRQRRKLKKQQSKIKSTE